jgi:hypothetical protein
MHSMKNSVGIFHALRGRFAGIFGPGGPGLFFGWIARNRVYEG